MTKTLKKFLKELTGKEVKNEVTLNLVLPFPSTY